MKELVPLRSPYSQTRRAICNTCEHKKVVTNVSICGRCGCVLKFKTSLASAKCPINKW